jgi:ribosomal protein S18 acetylase RimI-like enzyme
METIEIRKAKPLDAQGIARCHRLGWIEAHVNPDYDITKSDIEEYLEDLETSQSNFKKYVEKGTPYYVAIVDNEVVGYTGCFKDGNDWTGSTYLDPKYIRQGIGTKLKEALFTHFTSGEYFFVGMAVNNKAPQALNKKFGFKDTGERKDFKLGDSGKSFPLMFMGRTFEKK